MKFYKFSFFVLLLIIIGAASFYYGSYSSKQSPKKKEKIFTEKKVSPSPKITEEIEESISPTKKINDLNYIKENIRDAISSKNTAALEGYMTDSVNVILEASECCGALAKNEAISKLDYLKDAVGPWNFDQTNETIKKLKQTEPAKYGPEEAYIGIASNEFTVAFKFNKDNQINAITMAATYKLILP